MGNSEAANCLGLLYEKDQAGLAEECYQLAIEKDGNSEAMMNLGMLFTAGGKV